jgi:hypothetical protein
VATLYDYFDRGLAARWPAGRALAAVVTVPGIPAAGAGDPPSFLPRSREDDAAVAVGWSGYLFGGVIGVPTSAAAAPELPPCPTDMSVPHVLEPCGGVKLTKPMVLSDVWYFQSTGGGAGGAGFAGADPSANISWTYLPPVEGRTAGAPAFHGNSYRAWWVLKGSGRGGGGGEGLNYHAFGLIGTALSKRSAFSSQAL